MARMALGVFITALALFAAPAQAQMAVALPPLSDEALDGWLTTFNEVNIEGKGVNVDLVLHLNTLNQWIDTARDIELFREWKNDDAVVKALIPLAAGPFSETRVPATLVLGNVVDNTNVCHVIAYLAGTLEVSANGQFNLLQVVLQVANYASSETGGWISALVVQKEEQLAGQSDVENTIKLLVRIREALGSRNTDQSMGRALPEEKRAECVAALSGVSTGGDLVAPLFPETIADLTGDLLREKLFSSDRQGYATHLAALYDKGNEADRAKLVSAIISAIIPQKEDPERRYRVNLYIAVTFTRMASGALGEPAQQAALLGLRDTAEYLEDSTFKDDVDAAIAKQGL